MIDITKSNGNNLSFSIMYPKTQIYSVYNKVKAHTLEKMKQGNVNELVNLYQHYILVFTQTEAVS